MIYTLKYIEKMNRRGHNVVKLEAPLKPKNGGSKYPHIYVLPLNYMTDNVSTSLANASGKDLGLIGQI
jgi:hypothetical protein